MTILNCKDFSCNLNRRVLVNSEFKLMNFGEDHRGEILVEKDLHMEVKHGAFELHLRECNLLDTHDLVHQGIVLFLKLRFTRVFLSLLPLLLVVDSTFSLLVEMLFLFQKSGFLFVSDEFVHGFLDALLLLVFKFLNGYLPII